MNNFISVRGGWGQECTHNESLQIHPIITDQKPYITGNPKATRSAASGDCGMRVGVDLENRICSYCQYRCVHTSHFY